MEEHFCFQLSTFETRCKTYEVSRLAISAHYTLEMTLTRQTLSSCPHEHFYFQERNDLDPHSEWNRNVRYKLKHSDLPHEDCFNTSALRCMLQPQVNFSMR